MDVNDGIFARTSVLPNVPAAWIRSIGFEAFRALGFGLGFEASDSGGGFPMNVSLSKEGSSSDRASRSHED